MEGNEDDINDGNDAGDAAGDSMMAMMMMMMVVFIIIVIIIIIIIIIMLLLLMMMMMMMMMVFTTMTTTMIRIVLGRVVVKMISSILLTQILPFMFQCRYTLMYTYPYAYFMEDERKRLVSLLPENSPYNFDKKTHCIHTCLRGLEE